MWLFPSGVALSQGLIFLRTVGLVDKGVSEHVQSILPKSLVAAPKFPDTVSLAGRVLLCPAVFCGSRWF